MFEICKPFSWEIEFYKEHNIPLWECNVHETVDLGQIWKDEDGSYIRASVTAMSAQFWKFQVFDAESKTTYEIGTGSGGLMNFFDAVKLMASNMLCIKSIAYL